MSALAAVAAAAQAMREDRAQYRASLLEYRRTLRATNRAGHSYSELASVADVSKSAVAQAIAWIEKHEPLASSDTVQ